MTWRLQTYLQNKADKIQYHTFQQYSWIKLVDKIKKVNEDNNEVKIALIGKYVKLDDSYLSVIESLKHGGILMMLKLVQH